MLSRMLTTAIIAGVLAGLATTVLQVFWSVPVIIEAEMYEFGILNADGSLAAGAMDQYVAAQSNLWDRYFKTFLANIINGVGLGMLMVAIFAFRPVSGWREGLLWGLAGFIALNVAPSVGLPPKLPGTQTAPLEDRQFWWIATVLATGGGIALIAFARVWAWRLFAVALIAAPHIVGAPVPDDQTFASPITLQREFIAASLGTAVVLWLVLGGAIGFLSARHNQTTEDGSLPAHLNT